jgi:uncharacterized membrane protein
VHIIGNGDTAAIIFFGAFLVTALAGMPSIDAKLARRDRETWQAVSGATSIVPFVAIARGRNRGWRARTYATCAQADANATSANQSPSESSEITITGIPKLRGGAAPR